MSIYGFMKAYISQYSDSVGSWYLLRAESDL